MKNSKTKIGALDPVDLNFRVNSKKEGMLKIPKKYISARLALMHFTNGKMCVTRNKFWNKMKNSRDYFA